MASNVLRALAPRSARLLLNGEMAISKYNKTVRLITTTDTGSVLSKPEQVRFGLIKVTLVVTPFLLGGATISREFAAWLEEHELFVPDDDDD